MECKNLIIITGISCQGKTYTAMELQKKCGFYVIHTDWFYHPLDREGLKCQVGEEDLEKNKLIREQIPLLTETTVIEGSHVGNQQELDIIIRELDFYGNLYIFKIESPNLKEQFKSKHKGNTRENWIGISKWFKSIYNIRNAIVVKGAEDIINFLEIYNGNICLSG